VRFADQPLIIRYGHHLPSVPLSGNGRNILRGMVRQLMLYSFTCGRFPYLGQSLANAQNGIGDPDPPRRRRKKKMNCGGLCDDQHRKPIQIDRVHTLVHNQIAQNTEKNKKIDVVVLRR
jgi:hypothetical protein